MKVAIVGTGKISETVHIPILESMPNVDVVAVCDENKKRLMRIADHFKIKHRFSDVDEMLRSIDLDMVDMATPGFTHYELAKKVLSHNLNLIVEKPLTLKASDAENLDSESRKRNLKIGVCQTYRYREPIIQFQKTQADGGIGNIDKIITVQRGSSLFALPKWFWDENVSGGILFELGAHAVDLQCYLLGPATEVLSVNITYDKTIDFTTSISSLVKFKKGMGVIDLQFLSSSTIFHQYIYGTVSDAIIKFFPDCYILQRGNSILPETIGELKRMLNFAYTALRKKLYEKERNLHRIILDNFISVLNTENQPLVPISSVVPTIRLMEDIWGKVSALKKQE